MKPPRVRLAPGVPDLAALGARSVDGLFVAGGLEGEPQAEDLGTVRGATLRRVPLPGTPGPGGRRIGRPRGAGTGWIWVERFEHASLTESLRARLGHPRSTSLAARGWNLLCHLRAQGVPTPEPLAVGELGGEPFARRSVLVVRELERAAPLPSWWSEAGATERRAAARALGELLARVARAGVVLPELALADLLLAQPRTPPGAGCGSPLPGLRSRRLPELALARVRGGRLGRLRERAGLGELERLGREALASSTVRPRELLAVWYRARGRGLARGERRRDLAHLVRRLGRGFARSAPTHPAP